ncbi:MAG: hypothetical protein ACN6O2_06165 [Stenotrophomonas sp.]
MRSVLLAVTVACCGVLLTGCGNGKLTEAQHSALATLGKQLPKPYRDGLITDSAHRHGDDIVFVVRFPGATVAMAKAKPEVFEALRRDEDESITELCMEPALAPVYAAGGGVRRRFVDAKGAVFFEVELKAKHCTPH